MTSGTSKGRHHQAQQYQQRHTTGGATTNNHSPKQRRAKPHTPRWTRYLFADDHNIVNTTPGHQHRSSRLTSSSSTKHRNQHSARGASAPPAASSQFYYQYPPINPSPYGNPTLYVTARSRAAPTSPQVPFTQPQTNNQLPPASNPHLPVSSSSSLLHPPPHSSVRSHLTLPPSTSPSTHTSASISVSASSTQQRQQPSTSCSRTSAKFAAPSTRRRSSSGGAAARGASSAPTASYSPGVTPSSSPCTAPTGHVTSSPHNPGSVFPAYPPAATSVSEADTSGFGSPGVTGSWSPTTTHTAQSPTILGVEARPLLLLPSSSTHCEVQHQSPDHHVTHANQYNNNTQYNEKVVSLSQRNSGEHQLPPASSSSPSVTAVSTAPSQGRSGGPGNQRPHNIAPDLPPVPSRSRRRQRRLPAPPSPQATEPPSGLFNNHNHNQSAALRPLHADQPSSPVESSSLYDAGSSSTRAGVARGRIRPSDVTRSSIDDGSTVAPAAAEGENNVGPEAATTLAANSGGGGGGSGGDGGKSATRSALSGPLASAFAFAVWRRRRAIQNITEQEDLALSCLEVLVQFNKKLARLHYLLMFLGLPERGSNKLQDELVANRRGCMEMCWHIRDNLFAKMTRTAMQGEASAYVRTLTDCLEMYAKELAILSYLYGSSLIAQTAQGTSNNKKKGKTRTQKVHPSGNNTKPDDVISTAILDSERQEVMELLQMMTNKLTARTDADPEQITTVETTSTTTSSAMLTVRKMVQPSNLFFCSSCFCADDYR